MEINKNRIWVLASNKHRTGGALQFWGTLTEDSQPRSYCGYPENFDVCERYSDEDKKEMTFQNYPTLDSKSSVAKLTSVPHYWITVEELGKCKCFKKQTVFVEI